MRDKVDMQESCYSENSQCLDYEIGTWSTLGIYVFLKLKRWANALHISLAIDNRTKYNKANKLKVPKWTKTFALMILCLGPDTQVNFSFLIVFSFLSPFCLFVGDWAVGSNLATWCAVNTQTAMVDVNNEESLAGTENAEPLGRLAILYYGAGHMLNDITSACWFTYLLLFLTEIGLSPRYIIRQKLLTLIVILYNFP